MVERSLHLLPDAHAPCLGYILCFYLSFALLINFPGLYLDVSQNFYLLFLWHWGLNSGPTP
jgi:hypothetical protein